MATQGERRALIFLAGVALLGAATRVYRGRHVSVDAAALDQQIEAVDGSRTSEKGNRKRSSTRRSPRMDSSAPSPGSQLRVDLDVATAREIERLPGIGPGLAKRIINEREEKGPFGCLAALDRVKGVGPALLARIDSLATFSAAGGALCASAARPPGG